MAQLKFLDISHHDNDRGPIDWDQLSKNVDGFTVKITEGTTFVDPKSADNVANARKTGKPVGGYHFFHGQGKAEADFFKSKLPDVDFVAIDCEDAKLDGDLTNEVLVFASEMTVPVILYGSPSYIKDHFNNTITKLKLWVAHYGVDKPDTAFWTDYALWQYSSKESVPGKTGPSDLSYVSQSFYDLIKPKPKVVAKPAATVHYLQKGDKGPEVKNLQQDLIKVGEHLPRFGADSQFGDETDQAVKAFQVRSKITVDGIVGPQTRSKLEQAIKYTPVYHTVQKDENLSVIATKNGISLAQIEKLNPQIKHPDVIHQGDKIRVK